MCCSPTGVYHTVTPLQLVPRAFNIRKGLFSEGKDDRRTENRLIEATLFNSQTFKPFCPKRMPFLNVMTFSNHI